MQRGALTSERAPAVALGLVMVIAAYVLLHAARGTTFYYDDWNFAIQRLDWRPYTLLVPHNEHFSLVPVVIYKVVLSAFGLEHYWVLRVVNLILNFTCGLLVFLYGRPRVGGWIAAALAAALMLMGQAYWDVIWAFQIGFLGSVAAGLGALHMLDRNTRRGDLAACVLLGVALSSSSLGIPILVGVAVEIVVGRRLRARWWVVAVPAVMYVAWYLKYGFATSDFSKLPNAAHNSWDGLTAATSAITGTPPAVGTFLAVALIAAIGLRLSQPGPIPARLIGALAIPVAFWSAVAVARDGLPASEARYLYPAGAWIAIVAFEAFPREHLPRGRLLALVVAMLATGVVSNAVSLEAGALKLRNQANITRFSLTAAEIYGIGVLGPNALPDPGQPQLFMARYETGVTHYDSSVGYSQAEIPRLAAPLRQGIDEALLRIVPPALEPVDRKPASAQSCRSLRTGGEIFLHIRSSPVFLRAGQAQIELHMRRFGDVRLSIPPVPPGQKGLIGRPRDESLQPWELQARSTAPFEACVAG